MQGIRLDHRNPEEIKNQGELSYASTESLVSYFFWIILILMEQKIELWPKQDISWYDEFMIKTICRHNPKHVLSQDLSSSMVLTAK